MHLMLAQLQKQCPSRSRKLPQPDRARHPNLLGAPPTSCLSWKVEPQCRHV